MTKIEVSGYLIVVRLALLTVVLHILILFFSPFQVSAWLVMTGHNYSWGLPR